MSSRLATAVLLSICAISRASAEWQPNLKVGQLEIHPSYDLKSSYDDNIYRTAPDKADGTRQGCLPGNAGSCSGGVIGSWLMTNNLGLNLVLPVADMHKFSLGYGMSAANYQHDPKSNNAISQNVNAAYSFKGAVLSAGAFTSYVNTQDPAYNPNARPITAAGATATGGELVKREHRWNNTVGGNVEYALGDQFFFGVDGSDARQKYVAPALAATLDRSEQSYGVKTGYKIQPKTRAFVAAHRTLTHYSSGRRGANHKGWTTDFGVEGELTGKLKGRVQTGFAHRAYEDDGVTPVPSPASNKTTNWTFGVGLNYKPLDRTTIDLSATRGLIDATGVRFNISNSLNLAVSHSIDKLTVGASGGLTIDKYGDSQTTPAGTDPVTLLPIGRSANRRDDSYTGGVSAQYQIQKWLTASVDYKHMRRHSIFTWEYNYKANITTLGLKAAF
ncbi:MAG: outer membrane beta-barrel protein [Elusimicrobia bacterium]|nr:outer membrane beta-barrel protein [Elusimicrobiota bacterium]